MTTDESNATRQLACIRTPIGGHRAPRRAPTRCLAWHSGAHPAPPVSRESLLAAARLLLDLLEVEVAAPGGRKRCSGHWARTKGGSEATNGPLARKLRLGAGHRGLGRGHRRLVREAPEARRARTLEAAGRLGWPSCHGLGRSRPDESASWRTQSPGTHR